MRFSTCLLLTAASFQAPSGVTGQFADTNVNPNAQSCSADGDCPLIQCFIPPCPDAVCVDGFCQVEADPPSPECVRDSDCPAHNCFTTPCDIPFCNAGICDLQPAPAADKPNSEEDQTVASPTEGDDLSCGPNTCLSGQVCCNKSCGYCTEPGGVCTEEYCLSPEEDNGIVPQVDEEEDMGEDLGEDLDFSDNYTCDVDSDCPVINCLVAPCDQYICNTTLGECTMTGAACGFYDYDDDMLVANHKNATQRYCPLGQVCCNASCGICTLPGDFCTQQMCSYDNTSFSESFNDTASPTTLDDTVTISRAEDMEDEEVTDQEEAATNVDDTQGTTTDGATTTTDEEEIAVLEESSIQSQSTRRTVVMVSSIAMAATSFLYL